MNILDKGPDASRERIGGDRNWDYRYFLLRDATFTLNAHLETGFYEEASAWSAWL